MLSYFKNLLKLPLHQKLESIDSPQAYVIHNQIIKTKKILQSIYDFYYKQLLRPFSPIQGKTIIEIGAGAFNSNNYSPDVITTDLEGSPYVKRDLNAHEIDYPDCSVDGFILLNVLHHIPRPGDFFKEANRCLKPGGKIILIEPYFSPWGAFVNKVLHHEPVYDIEDWNIPVVTGGRLSDANCMMPYNIFIRDRSKFERLFPNLEIQSIKLHTKLVYVLSGGLSYISMIPDFLIKPFWMLEALLSPLNRWLACNMTVTLKKKD